ncbi:hypothetical protein JNUCC1_02813 [Lentibacillus sp. JNUCC-1]|uniref:hypothetical protein n=1 Tax=Lentibacillus sp. JNUCC-1 TaxID=2654513 RepID=UPI0012E7B7E6|nr:hypothetical protein [Lentibacillus sp. JNUCC-1]MUV38941.1 hypothetical protein [Lentibacillus sp. JNUCC-1]
MKRSLFFIPAVIFTVLYGAVAILDTITAVSPVVLVWLALFFISGFLLIKNIYWGSLLGILPAIHMIYMGTQETGQIINETPIGIVVLVFYVICGFIVYRWNKKASQS